MKKVSLLALLCLTPSFLFAQNTGTGVQPFGSYTQGGFDTINNQDLNAMFTIPLVSSAGRGLPLALNLGFNSQIYSISGGVIFPASNFGWTWDMPPGGISGNTTTTSNQVKCLKAGWPLWVTNTYYTNYYFTDAFGNTHHFPNITWTELGCGDTWSGTGSGYASDATGYYMTTGLGVIHSVTGPGGQQFPNSNTAVDTNGNFVSRATVTCTGTPPCVETDWTDSVGNKALKIIYTPNNTSPTQIQYQFLDPNGAYQTITLTLETLNVATTFACSASEYTGTATVPHELDVPTPAGGKLKYLFSYEPTTSGKYSGRLQKITLPTGGSYEYDYPAPNDGINCSDGSALTMNRVVSDGTNSATWNFVRNIANRTTTVTTPALADTSAANSTVYTFNTVGQETSNKVYATTTTTGTPLRAFNTTWTAYGTPATQITILEDGTTQSEVDTSIDSNGLLDSKTEYDWGSGSKGNAIRTTSYTYQTGTAWTSLNIINLLTSKQIRIGGSTGAITYRQDLTYDGVPFSSCPTGASQHDDTNFTCAKVYRGNPTSITTYLTPATSTGGITKHFTYDWFGNLVTAQLNCCTTKTWVYSVTTQYSRPDSITSGSSPTQVTANYQYNTYTDLLTKVTDPNSLVTNSSYDFLRRTTQVAVVGGSTTTYSYDDVNFKTTVASTIDPTNSVQEISVFDGLGRTLTATIEDASGTLYSIVQSKYDLAGRAYSTSNPYTTSAQYWTTKSFDALGRSTSTKLPDNSQSTSSFVTNTVTMTDSAGNKRKSVFDGAARMSSLYEPDFFGNPTVPTFYTYTVLDQLASTADAVSGPTQTRSYSYDALGRFLSTNTPEGGTTCFGTVSGGNCTSTGAYDNFDNLLLRTDARGVLTTYTYDGLNRLTGVSYNVGSSGVAATPSVALTYGASGCATTHGAGCIGQLITKTDGPGSENYTYNALERLTLLQKVIGTTTYNTQYAYNLAGELTQIIYPSTRVVQLNLDVIGRLCSVGSTGSTCTTGTTFATGFGYNAAQQPTGFNYGNGVSATFGYSPDRLQLTSLSYAKGGTTLFGLTYSYGGAANNGQIQGITDNVQSGRTVSYTYDQLSRLSSASTTGSTGYAGWGLSWTYDRYGNATNQTQTKGNPPYYSVTISPSTNHIFGTPFAYDLSGNVTNDGYNTLTYDAENRILSATNASTSGAYTYDGNNSRVKRVTGSTTTVYIFSGSKVIAEYDNGAAVGSPSREYIYSGGTLLAKVDSTGTKYYHQDHLSNRLVTDVNGNTVAQLGHFPFGESWYNSTNDKLQFTSYERDAESGNDYAQARYYASRLSRFLALDPISGTTSDPQSLNRYAYVGNDPTDATDPSGQMQCVQICPNWNGAGGSGGGDNGGFLIIDLGPAIFGETLPDTSSAGWEGGYFTWQFIPFPSPGGGANWSGYNGRADFRDYAVQLSNNKAMSDCEKLARLINKAGQAFGPIGGVTGLLNGLTEVAGPFNGKSDPNYRVGVYKSDPFYASSFGTTGFLSQYVDNTPGSTNQVRHFAGWFAAGHYYGDNNFPTKDRLYKEEDSDSPLNPDVALGLAAIKLGASFGTDVPLDFGSLAQNVWHSICGGSTDLKF